VLNEFHLLTSLIFAFMSLIAALFFANQWKFQWALFSLILCSWGMSNAAKAVDRLRLIELEDRVICLENQRNGDPCVFRGDEGALIGPAVNARGSL